MNSSKSARRTSRPSSSSSKTSQPSKQTFECDICHRSFSRKDNLKTHQRLHSGEMPYECKYCGNHFRWAGALSTHEANHARDGHIVGCTLPALRRRKDQDRMVVKSSREIDRGNYGHKKPAKSSDRRDKGGRREREHGGSSSGSRQKGKDMVVISTEDPTLEMFMDGPWRSPVDEDGHY